MISAMKSSWSELKGTVVLIAVLPLALYAQNAPETLPEGASCATAECHQDVIDEQHLHGPVNLNQCEPCHIQTGNKHAFHPAEEGRDLCLICHEEEAPMPVVHPPFQAECTLCHDPHGGESRYFTKGGEGAESCRLCHGDVTQGMDFVHGPLALGECVVCHTPHQSEFESLLVEPSGTICLSCHVDMQERLDSAISVHEPVNQGCTQCHNAHGGKTRFFTAATGIDLCGQCHGDFIDSMADFKHPHTPMVEGKACENCHVTHVSNQEFLLQMNVGELCLNCHNKSITTETGKLDDIASQIKAAEFLHGPLREDNCVACHQAHGSDNEAILKLAFPENFYAPYEEGAYDLCFDCHDRTIIESESTTVTGFRNGTENLHYLHVNREKGRTCRACHHEHAANQPNHIRSETPFGRWVMEVNFEETETGGTCETGCHVPYQYDRQNPIDRSVSARVVE